MVTTILKPKCSWCGAAAEEVSRSTYGDTIFITLKCGHGETRHAVEEKSDYYAHFSSKDGKTPYPFQVTTMRKMEEAGGKFGIFHEMGLGKTICALGYLGAHKETFPVLWVCKAGLKLQTFVEAHRWIDKIAHIISSSNDDPLYELQLVIVSYDTLPKVKWLENHKFKTLILDECQMIKNSTAKRTQAVRKVAKTVENVIALSGTPIKNNAGEFFTILNLLRPERFRSEAGFLNEWCDTYSNGFSYKVGGIKRWKVEEFNKILDTFTLRYERSQVMPDLPKIDRRNYICDMSSPALEKAYADAYAQFEAAYEDGTGSFSDNSNIMAQMARLRHIAGVAKIQPVLEFVSDFLENTDRKITLFVHHKDVAFTLLEMLKKVCEERQIPAPLQIASDMDVQARYNAVTDFKNNGHRVMVASTLAAGEGLNLQFCSDCVIVERQWNPANEEQAEARFTRIGSEASSVTATYAVAIGTIDEYFAELVERKREIVRKTLGGEAVVKWDQSSLMKELADTLMSKGRPKWKL